MPPRASGSRPRRARDGIADAFVEYAKGRCDALVVFLIRDGNALGWRGYVAPPSKQTRPIEELSLPLGGTSALQTAHDGLQVFTGVPPSGARPIETQLWTALGAEPAPVEVVVVPVQVKQRAVNLVYTHTLGGTPPAAFRDRALRPRGPAAQTAYLRLIRQTRAPV